MLGVGPLVVIPTLKPRRPGKKKRKGRSLFRRRKAVAQDFIKGFNAAGKGKKEEEELLGAVRGPGVLKRGKMFMHRLVQRFERHW